MFKNLSVRALGVSGGGSEVIELALSFGFRSIDLNLVDFAEQVENHDLSHARRLLDSAKLKLGCFRLPVDWYDAAAFERDMKKLPKLAELAAELECYRATTTIQPASDERPFHENFEFHRARLSQIGAALSAAGIKLGVDFCTSPALREGKDYEFVHDFETLRTLLATVQGNNVGVAVDLWSLHVAGDGLAELARLTADQIVTVTLSDAKPDETSEESRLLPGETGVIDSAAALVQLAELGYQGPITPRAHPERFADVSRDATVKLAGEALENVWKTAGLTPRGTLPATAAK